MGYMDKIEYDSIKKKEICREADGLGKEPKLRKEMHVVFMCAS